MPHRVITECCSNQPRFQTEHDDNSTIGIHPLSTSTRMTWLGPLFLGLVITGLFRHWYTEDSSLLLYTPYLLRCYAAPSLAAVILCAPLLILTQVASHLSRNQRHGLQHFVAFFRCVPVLFTLWLVFTHRTSPEDHICRDYRSFEYRHCSGEGCTKGGASGFREDWLTIPPATALQTSAEKLLDAWLLRLDDSPTLGKHAWKLWEDFDTDLFELWIFDRHLELHRHLSPELNITIQPQRANAVETSSTEFTHREGVAIRSLHDVSLKKEYSEISREDWADLWSAREDREGRESWWISRFARSLTGRRFDDKDLAIQAKAKSWVQGSLNVEVHQLAKVIRKKLSELEAVSQETSPWKRQMEDASRAVSYLKPPTKKTEDALHHLHTYYLRAFAWSAHENGVLIHARFMEQAIGVLECEIHRIAEQTRTRPTLFDPDAFISIIAAQAAISTGANRLAYRYGVGRWNEEFWRAAAPAELEVLAALQNSAVIFTGQCCSWSGNVPVPQEPNPRPPQRCTFLPDSACCPNVREWFLQPYVLDRLSIGDIVPTRTVEPGSLFLPREEALEAAIEQQPQSGKFCAQVAKILGLARDKGTGRIVIGNAGIHDEFRLPEELTSPKRGWWGEERVCIEI